MKRIVVLLVGLYGLVISGWSQETVSLAGEWSVRLNEQKTGGQHIHLPGTLDDAGIGKASTLTDEKLNREVLLHLTRKHSYIGQAWYTRDVAIPGRYAGKHIELFLERVLWTTHVWVDGQEAGTRESLSAPHRYDLSTLLTPGRHRIVICVDNSKQYDMSIQDMAHAYTDGTQIIWNGILGRLQLIVRDFAFVRLIQAYPSVKDRSLTVKVGLQNDRQEVVKKKLLTQVFDAARRVIARQETEVSLSPGETQQEVRVSLAGCRLWDEFDPALYTVKASLQNPNAGSSGGGSTDALSTSWGMREIGNRDGLLWINGRRLFLRGTLECDIFPLTGHPPMDKKGWLKVFTTAKAYGLNHLRFHSWCPPEAAWTVADSLGFYLQVELPFWNKNAGKDARLNRFLEEEADRISREYGSHPSFCFWSMGNELEGDFGWLATQVSRLRQADPRHLYTSTTFSFQPGHGKWPEPGDDFYITQYTRKGWVRGQGIFNTYPPTFNTDYTRAVDSLPIPVIIHEMGQYSVYPRLEEIGKYTGVLDPLNFKAVRKDLTRKGMVGLAPSFTLASGKFSANLYKEEIERALKTKGMSGFDLLDLHDFPGQGTALVGILDAFWDSKGLVTPAEHRMYCSAVVPLIRYDKAVYTNDETFSAVVEVANFSNKVLKGSIPVWAVTDAAGKRIAGGRMSTADIAIGNGQSLGSFSVDLKGIRKASCLTVEVSLVGTSYHNNWRIWVYPRTVPLVTERATGPAEMVFDTTLEEAVRHLREGKKVLFNPDTIAIKGVAGRFAPVFWSPVHFPDQPGTMGILCDPRHPALAAFPTNFFSDWQWWDLITSSRTMILDSLPTLTPIVRVIDNFFKNRRMADVIEATVGKGKLILVSMDITHDLDKRPAARQLRYSLEQYMKGDSFHPSVGLSTGQLERLISLRGETMLRMTGDRLRQAAAQVRYLIRHTATDSFPETFDPRGGEPADGKSADRGATTGGADGIGRWGMGKSSSWMSGFYPGELFYLFQATGDSLLYKEALRKLGPLEKEQYNRDTHDLGFMMYCSFGNADRVVHRDDYTKIILNSARSLAGRFNAAVGCTRSWNSDSSRFMVIIDNMMNLELLFAATRITGDSSFYKIAVRHANTTMKNHFRPDYSSYHLVIYDPVTGAVKKKQTVQGAADESAWARGQAWGLYGYTVMYRETKDPKYLEQAEHIAGFILPRLPADKIPYWDFDAPRLLGGDAAHAGADAAIPRDVSAGTILCSALLELSEYVRGVLGTEYRETAEAMLRSLMSPAYLAVRGEDGGFLLQHGVGNFPKHSDVDVSLIYADYYYVEALLRYQHLMQRETILARYKKYLLDAIRPGNADSLAAAVDAAGRWPDIDYGDTQRANWQPLYHLERVRDLAITWSDARSEHYHDPRLWTALNRALDHWLKERYHNSNWWHNEIGVPQHMRDILVLLHDTLDHRRLAGALQVLGQYRLQRPGAGANLVWSADLGLHFGALTGNDTLIQKCARLVADEVRITTGDGIQPDYSFHQHYTRLQMYQYGAAFLQNNVRLAWELMGTDWAFPEEKVRLLANFILDGWQWMARGINTVPGTIDRSVSRVGALHSADLRSWIPYLCMLYPADEAAFRAIGDRQEGRGVPLEGYRYFPYSDFSVYQDRRFSFFLKTLSDRTLPTESINGENLKGQLLNSGDAYMIRTGQEYFNLMPVWDWTRLPGVTSFEGAAGAGRRSFTGGITDGHSGLTVMDYDIKGKDGDSLVARKFWACHDGMVVCLIGGLHTSGIKGDIFTTLDQCRWEGPITIGRGSRIRTVTTAGEQHLDSVTWLHHAGVTTLFLQPSRIDLFAGTVTGSWRSINTSGPTAPVTEKIYRPVLQHAFSREGGRDVLGDIGYVLTATTTAVEAAALARHPSWTICRNDGDCQAVRFQDGTILAAFYTQGHLTLTDGQTIVADKPCLMLISGEKKYVEDLPLALRP